MDLWFLSTNTSIASPCRSKYFLMSRARFLIRLWLICLRRGEEVWMKRKRFRKYYVINS